MKMQRQPIISMFLHKHVNDVCLRLQHHKHRILKLALQILSCQTKPWHKLAERESFESDAIYDAQPPHSSNTFTRCYSASVEHCDQAPLLNLQRLIIPSYRSSKVFKKSQRYQRRSSFWGGVL